MLFVGSIISFPYILLFYATWIIASLVRPVITLSLLLVLSNHRAALRKGQLFYQSLEYLIFCNDKKWKPPAEDPSTFFALNNKNDTNLHEPKIEKKTIIFIRHGESVWNETFNKGDRQVSSFVLYFLPNLIKAIFMEWYFWVSGRVEESWFFDSPLSAKGIRQAETVRTFLQQTNMEYATPKEAEFVRYLLGQSPSQVVSSNLRRAIATAGIGLQDRFAQQGHQQEYPSRQANSISSNLDRILILPALQEISRNPDALAITPPYAEIIPAWTDPIILKGIYKYHVDSSWHTGNKPIDSNGLKRMQTFCEQVFTDIPKECVIAVGHSLWFRSFFQTYIPYTKEHIAKKKKLGNGGVVAFTMQRIKLDSEYRYMIDPTSIMVLCGGF